MDWRATSSTPGQSPSRRHYVKFQVNQFADQAVETDRTSDRDLRQQEIHEFDEGCGG